MHARSLLIGIVLLIAFFLASSTAAEPPVATTISSQWFLNFQAGESDGECFNRFAVDRGYINIKHRLTERISGRITPDVSVDRDGDGEGDLEMRLKYCYADYGLPDWSFLTKPHLEFGLVHRPWLDFEEHVSRYRVQGTMFLERNGIFNSGDFGITFLALLGGEVGEEYRRAVHTENPGRRGSVALGFYNGGGYHGIENNENKTFEGRLTIRPLPVVAPGLQVSYQGAVGEGNVADGTDWTIHLAYLSWERRRVVLTGQYYMGKGNFRGAAVDENGDPREQTGFSFFGEVKSSGLWWSLIGRYDRFDDGSGGEAGDSERIVAGLARHLTKRSKLLLDYDIHTRGSWSDPEMKVLKLSTEFGF